MDAHFLVDRHQIGRATEALDYSLDLNREESMAVLSGKAALITGAAAGIGRAMAIKFADAGASLIICDVNEDGGKETEKIVREKGVECHFIKADVSQEKDVDSLVKAVLDTYGQIDCACNNAGVEGKIAPFADQQIDNFDHIMAVNARGVFLCMRDEIKAMLANKQGAIVNTASIAGLIGFPGLSPYVASKHAVNGMTKNAALEYAQQGIRVNAICPGGIDTRMLDSLAEQSTGGEQTSREMMAPLHPMGRIGEPDEIADLALWLCSPQASFITGVSIPVDGGYVAQ